MNFKKCFDLKHRSSLVGQQKLLHYRASMSLVESPSHSVVSMHLHRLPLEITFLNKNV